MMKNSIIIFIAAVIVSGCALLTKNPEPEIITKVEYVDKVCVTNLPDKFSYKDIDWVVIMELIKIDIDYDDCTYSIKEEYNSFYDTTSGYKERSCLKEGNVIRYLKKEDDSNYGVIKMYTALTHEHYKNSAYNTAEMMRYIKQSDEIIKQCRGEQ